MNQPFFISIVLDTRRLKSNGKYPVKLRVFTSTPRKQKLYPTKFDFTKDEFESIWESLRPRGENKKLKKQIQAIEVKANEVAEKITPFSFEQFEKKLFQKKGEGIKVSYQFSNKIEALKDRNQISTANTYELSEKSIISFLKHNKKTNYNSLILTEITSSWLNDYENYMLNIKGRSQTTIGIYLRNLRALFNIAISDKEIKQEDYPFGKNKYQIPKTRNVKKALTKEELKTFYYSEPKTKEQEKAKDFWFLSYACNGMNIKDIALLKVGDLKQDRIEFYRAKTRLTSKSNLKTITIFLNDSIKETIEKYRSKNINPNDYLFDILNINLSPVEKQKKIKNFTRFVNQHIKKIAIDNELPKEISSYWARHSFASIGIKQGASMEFMQESLGHGNISTTQSYFSGFDSDTKKEFANSIMDFK